MVAMHNILLPVDSSEERATAQSDAVRDVPHAAEEVRVYLLHVFDDRDIAEKTAVRQTTGGNVAHERLGRVGIDVEPMSRHGDPAQEIIRAAEEIDADRILLGGRKRSPLGSLLFGSVTQEVMLDTSRPVVVTGEAETTEDPSHRCASCGERYYTDRSTEIETCRSCGGAKVDVVE
jgi:nucleotide-binding universal stress UspA family protein